MTDVTNLKTLERRITERVDDECAEAVKEEFDQFRVEVERMGSEPDLIGQATLTDHEISRLKVGNQYSEYPSIIEWQCVKAAAIHYNIPDWTSKVDSSLTYEENIDRLKFLSSGGMDEAKEKARMRWREQEV